MKRDAECTFAPAAGCRPRIEPEYLCALSMRVMHDPVMVADPAHPAACFDGAVLEQFIAQHGVSPLTGACVPYALNFKNHGGKAWVIGPLNGAMMPQRRRVRPRMLSLPLQAHALQRSV